MFEFNKYVSVKKRSWIDKITDINYPTRIIGEYAGAHAHIEIGYYYGINRIYWITVNIKHFYSGERVYLITIMGGRPGNIQPIAEYHVNSTYEAYTLYKTLIEKYSK